MTDTYTCPWHETQIPRGTECRACIERYATLPPAETMTPDQRAAELADLFDKELVVTIPMADLVGRIDALVGRPVLMHEMGTSGFPSLIEEARTGRAQTRDEVMGHLPPHLERIVVVTD